jgi:hypothetical protein
MAKWNRRQFLSGLLAAAGAEATLDVVEARAEAPVLPTDSSALPSVALPPPSTVPSPPALDGGSPSALDPLPDGSPHALQTALPEGLRFGRWRIVSVLPVKLGAVPVILETRHGVRFQVDILRRDRGHGARRGIAETRYYALYLSNLGRGTKRTREEHGLGLIWLAALLRACERRHARPALLTLRERLLRHRSGHFDAMG